MTAIHEGYVPVSDGRVWYRVAGADRPGIPLLCLHGGPGAPHEYLETLEGFTDERPVVFFDQMGCGNSERPGDPEHWTIDAFVEELAEVRLALGLSRMHLMGQSWGTILAVEYVLQKKPAGVVSLVLSGPVMSLPRFAADQRRALEAMAPERQQVIRRAEAAGDFTSRAYEEAMMEFYRVHVCRLDPWPDAMIQTMEKLDHGVYEYMQGPSEFTGTGTLKDYECVSRLGELDLPVLYTCGEYDECTPAATRYYHEQTPGSEYVVFANASHEHHLEKPDEYLRVVGDFMRRVERRL